MRPLLDRRVKSPPQIERLTIDELKAIAFRAPIDRQQQSVLERLAWREITMRGGV
jgi:hypothetical protein